MEERKNNETLSASLIRSISSPEISEISQDISEIAFDSLLDDGVIKEIPVISTMVKLAKTILTVRDRIFMKKILGFLKELDAMSSDEKQKLQEKIEEDERFQERVGETLLMILERYDDLKKPNLLAKLFRGYLRGEIDYDQFQRLASAINRAYMRDIEALLNYYTVDEHKAEENLWVNWESLYSCGFSKIKIGVDIDQEYGLITAKSRYSSDVLVNYLGNSQAELFAKVILGEKHRHYFLFNQ